MKFDPTKPCTTRDGRKVVIYCTDALEPWPIHGRIEGMDYPFGWRENGQQRLNKGEYDIVNIPEKIVAYVDVWQDALGCLRFVEPSFSHYVPGDLKCIAKNIRIEFTRGEGL